MRRREFEERRHERERRSAPRGCQDQCVEAGPARLARRDGSGRRGDAHQRRRARARDRRHRRHLSAQDRQPGGAVRRHSRLPQGLPHPRQHPHLEPPHQHDDGQSGGRQRDRAGQALAALHEGGQDLPAGRGEERRAAGERQDRRRHRPVQDPGAEVARARRRLLHRHRRHGGDEGSRHRLDQLRRLSRAGARQEARHRDVLQGQARRHDPAQVSRARAAVPGRGGVRHASGVVHDRRPRNPARQERIRRGRRAARRACRGHHGAEDRVCRSRRMPRSRSRASSIRTTSATKVRSASGPAITPAA